MRIRSGIQTHRPSRRTGRPLLLTAALASLALGCGLHSSPHAADATAPAGEIISMQSAQGKHWLRLEFQRVPAVRKAVDHYGVPDYVVMLKHRELHLVYVGRDEAVTVKRGLSLGLRPPRRISHRPEVPGDVLALLPEAERLRVEVRRAR